MPITPKVPERKLCLGDCGTLLPPFHGGKCEKCAGTGKLETNASKGDPSCHVCGAKLKYDPFSRIGKLLNKHVCPGPPT